MILNLIRTILKVFLIEINLKWNSRKLIEIMVKLERKLKKRMIRMNISSLHLKIQMIQNLTLRMMAE